MRWLLAQLITLMGSLPVPALGHGGGLAADGCHYDRRSGTRHCHGVPARRRPPQRTYRVAAPSSKVRRHEDPGGRARHRGESPPTSEPYEVITVTTATETWGVEVASAVAATGARQCRDVLRAVADEFAEAAPSVMIWVVRSSADRRVLCTDDLNDAGYTVGGAASSSPRSSSPGMPTPSGPAPAAEPVLGDAATMHFAPRSCPEVEDWWRLQPVAFDSVQSAKRDGFSLLPACRHH